MAWKRYLLYLLRWQLSTPILAPIISYFKHSASIFGTKDDWRHYCQSDRRADIFLGGQVYFQFR